MAHEVILPKVDMDMATGTISSWHVKDGDRVSKGQAIFDIETDKAAMEIEAPGDGVIMLAPNAGVGAKLPIGALVAMIYGAGEDAKPLAAQSNAVPAVTPAATAATTRPANTLEPLPQQGGKPRATPLARRLAREAGIALERLQGSGPRGRIVAADVQSGAGKADAQTVLAKPAAAPDAAALRAGYQPGSYSEIPLDGMRRTIAQRLTQSKQTVPHFYLSATCTIDTLLAIRERLNGHAPLAADKVPRWKLSINDFIIKALATALQEIPAANVTFAEDALLQHVHSDVGVAVAVEGGLFTPVIRRAEQKSLAAISAEMKDLAAKARSRKLQPADYQGGSAAISNLGMYGIERFSAIINPPQACILAVGAAVERFVPVNRQPVLATQMELTLSCDHRAIDGAVGAQLLSAVKRLIEDPALMLV